MNKAIPIMNYPEGSYPSGGAAGRKRDGILSETLAESTFRFLQKFDFEKSTLGLDLGCGAGDVTLQLKSLMGKEGKMIGMDLNATNVNIARERATFLNQTNIDFFQKDISAWRETEQYDFVYSCLLFNQLSQPLKVLQQIFQSLKTGGWVMIEDMDLSGCYCIPNNYAFERYAELYKELKRRQGVIANIGNQFVSLLRNANFEHIQVQVVRPTFLNKEGKQIPSLSLEYISDHLIKEQLATPSEIQALLFELKSFENRTDTFITLPGIYQAWGYKRYPISIERN